MNFAKWRLRHEKGGRMKRWGTLLILINIVILTSCAGNTELTDTKKDIQFQQKVEQNQVLDPSTIKPTANIKISGDVFKKELIDKGSTKINVYDVIPQLDDFVNDSVINKDYEIIDYKVINSDIAMENEFELTKSQNRCISVEFSTSENFLSITSDNNFQSIAKAGRLLIAYQKHNVYKILTDNMIFNVKVSEEFDNQFNELFLLNSSASHQLGLDEIMDLSANRKQDFMGYISKNLGLESLELRDDYTVDTKLLQLENGSFYKILTFSDSYISRLLIFKNNDKKSNSYIGNVDIRSRGDKTEYKIKRIGNRTFIVVEKNCRGYGTGSLTYSQDWYIIDGDSVKTVLSIPSIREEVRDYGFSLELKSLDVQNSNDKKLCADYKLSKMYTLELPIADEFGYVTVTAYKQVEFVWDERQKCFTSKYKFDDEGLYDFISDFKEIKNKCNKILDKYYTQLKSNITASSTDVFDTKRSYKEFFEDAKADKLKTKLKQIHPELYITD